MTSQNRHISTGWCRKQLELCVQPSAKAVNINFYSL